MIPWSEKLRWWIMSDLYLGRMWWCELSSLSTETSRNTWSCGRDGATSLHVTWAVSKCGTGGVQGGLGTKFRWTFKSDLVTEWAMMKWMGGILGAFCCASAEQPLWFVRGSYMYVFKQGSSWNIGAKWSGVVPAVWKSYLSLGVWCFCS